MLVTTKRRAIQIGLERWYAKLGFKPQHFKRLVKTHEKHKNRCFFYSIAEKGYFLENGWALEVNGLKSTVICKDCGWAMTRWLGFRLMRHLELHRFYAHGWG